MQNAMLHTFSDCGVHLLTHDHNDCDHDVEGRPLFDGGDIFAQCDASTQGQHHGCIVLAEELELVAVPVLPHISAIKNACQSGPGACGASPSSPGRLVLSDVTGAGNRQIVNVRQTTSFQLFLGWPTWPTWKYGTSTSLTCQHTQTAALTACFV